MKGDTDNPQGVRWTDDPVQQEKFFTEVGPRIASESGHIVRRYRVGMCQEDVESEVNVKLMQQMRNGNSDGPFAKGSPEEAAGVLSENKNYAIRELARPPARKEARTQSRQAEIFADLGAPDVTPDKEKELLELAEGIGRVSSVIPNFTPRDRDIFCKEMFRLMGIDDLPAEGIDQAAKAAGASGFEVRAYLEYHDEHGHSSERDRKAWSRARAKVEKALTRAAFRWLLAIVFALTLALLNAIHQGRSDHQNDLAHQGNLIDEVALAHQGKFSDEIARDHQDNLSDEIARDHQDKLGDEIALTHQDKLIDEIALTHQSKLLDEMASVHQRNLIREALDA